MNQSRLLHFPCCIVLRPIDQIGPKGDRLALAGVAIMRLVRMPRGLEGLHIE